MAKAGNFFLRLKIDRKRTTPLDILRTSPLFDPVWYRETHPDLRGKPFDAAKHYLEHGATEGRNPGPGFDTKWYLQQNPDVASSGMNALVHYILYGAKEGRDPHPLFDSRFYLEKNPDVAASGIDPLSHYMQHGEKEGRNPSDKFDVNFYLETNPDIAASGQSPLSHYLSRGAAEGRIPKKANTILARTARYVPPSNLLPWFSPLNLEVESTLSDHPHLNVLVPGLAMKHMSGGPNTAINLAGRLAGLGIPVRFCSTDAPIDADGAPFWSHLCRLADLTKKPVTADLVDMSNRAVGSQIGENDLFMATAWWTAQMAKYAIKLTNIKKFIYLIQDYEPLLHAASTSYALAMETYSLDHVGVINTELLRDFLVHGKIGLYANEAFARNALVFNPAVDRTLFYPSLRPTSGKRRLLFYARPTNGLRNLFELGVAALQKCLFDGVFDPAVWEFVGMGEAFSSIDLGMGCILSAAPWLDLDGYAAQMRESDILLSLMLSPHPSYPPLEMALCDRPVVTNIFANKSAERLAAFSPNIFGVEPTIEGICEGIRLALGDRRGATVRSRVNEPPSSWAEALSKTVPQLQSRLLEMFGAPPRVSEADFNQVQTATKAPEPEYGEKSNERAVGFRSWPKNAYEVTKFRRQLERRSAYASAEPSLISFLTTVWDTAPEFIDELAESVFGQDCGPGFEWIILDNGSTRQDTRDALARIASYPNVRFSRVPDNLGITGGMRHILQMATKRYIVPLDSDDILTPDCVRIITSYLKENGYPALAYTDEDKVLDGTYRDPYDKPDWDPVLFFHSCYVAHLGCLNRELAIELELYQDDKVAGCHDYDSFTRFYLKGYRPLHIPEIVYTWRMHRSSTAGNITSKDYISTSQRNLLRKFLDVRAPRFSVEPSRFFNQTPDWHFVRPRESPRSFVTLHFGEGAPPENVNPQVPHHSIELSQHASIRELASFLANVGDEVLCHFLWRGCRVDDADWPWEAMAQIDLFPDAVMVGGVVHRQGRIVVAPGHFGFGRGCESPDISRALSDPGYFAQLYKEHSVACVPVHHAVIEARFLRAALQRIYNADLLVEDLSPWLGALAREAGKRVIYSPFLRAEASVLPIDIKDGVWLAFRTMFPGLLEDASFLSRGVSRRIERAYRPIAPSERDREQDEASNQETSYAERTRAERLTRQLRSRNALPPRKPTIGLMTSVYERTDADLLIKVVESIRRQTSHVDEWIIIENGPISEAVTSVLRDAAADLPIRRLHVEKNLGLIAPLHHCLSQATAEYVSPLDYDDLLEPDAVEQVRYAINKTGADLIFTDEDAIVDDVPQAPFRRGPFDPILNAVDSYVWHFVVYRRARAIELQLYSDPKAEFCHDWDTLTRFSIAGANIHHIPEILYHWRLHSASTSGGGSLNEGSLRSVDWMLRQEIRRRVDPDLYDVTIFPLNRGVPQLCIKRKPLRPLPMAIFVAGATAHGVMASWLTNVAGILNRQPTYIDTSEATPSLSSCILTEVSQLPAEVRHFLVMAPNLELPDYLGLFEAMRMFEMHSQIGAIGGRIFDLNGRIVDIGQPLFREVDGKPYRWRGLKRSDPGAFALALKPQTAASLSDSLFFVRRNIVGDVFGKRHANSLSTVAKAITDAGPRLGYVCAYSPLIEAVLR